LKDQDDINNKLSEDIVHATYLSKQATLRRKEEAQRQAQAEEEAV